MERGQSVAGTLLGRECCRKVKLRACEFLFKFLASLSAALNLHDRFVNPWEFPMKFKGQTGRILIDMIVNPRPEFIILHAHGLG